MSRMVTYIGAVLMLCCFFLSSVSCDDDKNIKSSHKESANIAERKASLEKSNRYIVRQESEYIDDYVERRGLPMKKTGTGLRYCVMKQGDTVSINKGDIVTLEYVTRLITGDVVYSSKENGPKVFQVGKGGVESGLEEVMLLLHVNDVAEVIIPSHLAFGLLGDGAKIPPRATLIYNIKAVEKLST